MKRASTPALLRPLALALALAAVLLQEPAHAVTITGAGATFEITYTDGPTEGFHSAAAPLAAQGGNAGATLGEQRRLAFEQGAALWADILVSAIPIEVEASFDPLSCGPTSGQLGGAGFNSSHRDWGSGTPPPLANTWYPQPLANALAGVDLYPPVADISSEFNSSVGSGGCLTSLAWYYGFDANPSPSDIDFVTVVLHELGHGLGFVSLVNLSSGALAGGLDDAYSFHLEDHSLGLAWPAMTNAQRSASATDNGDLHWTGANVIAGGAALTGGRHASGHVQMYAPTSIQSGSSVSHFDIAVTPDEIMEPFITGANHDVTLTGDLLGDLGWPQLECGSGSIESPEECDDGNQNPFDGCTNACTICGNGATTAPEECDDGDLIDDDGCDSNCTLPACGNAVVNMGEGCDDANGSNTDACKNDCTPNVCGDGFLETGVEDCDDGDLVSGDGCDANCTPTGCGNGIPSPGEECDDGDVDPADGCTNWCTACGNNTITPPEQCDDGGLADGDGCEARCIVTGQLPLTVLVPPAPPSPDSASVNCLKAAGANSLAFAALRYKLATKCLDALTEYKARQTAALAPASIAAALAAATKKCVEPSPVAADSTTMLGKLAAGRLKAMSAIQQKCGTNGTMTVDGKTIAGASADFTPLQIDHHLTRVACEIDALLGKGYATAADDLALLSARPSQGGLSLDQSFSCIDQPELPAVDLVALPGVKDGASVTCQKAVGSRIGKAIGARHKLLRGCLDAMQAHDATVAAGSTPAKIAAAFAAAAKKCKEPSAAAPDSSTMLGKAGTAATKATAGMEKKCGTPGATTVDGKLVGNSASADFLSGEIQAHVATTSCSVDRLIGLAYNGAAGDLGAHDARPSQGGMSLELYFPCL